MTPSKHLLEFNLDLQHRLTQLEQDNQQLQAELTQLRQEHERLQQSETRYRQLFENAPVSMLFINIEGYITQMNRAAEQQFGATMEQLNQQACPIFTNPQLVENGTLPYMLRALAGETVIEEPTYYDTSKDFEGGKFQYSRGHYCPIRDKAEVVREIVEIAPDFSDLLASQQRLQQERERAATERIKLLGTIAQVANLLLRSSDYTSALPDVVRLLGEAVGSDRCCVTQEIINATTGKVAVKFVTEYSLVAISSDLGDPEYQSLGVIDEDPPSKLRQTLLQGQSANFLVADLPDSLWKAIFEAQECTSLLIVPIMVHGKCWGQIGFDNCGDPRLFDAAEIAILKIAADSIAAAIERREKDDELRKSEALYRSLFEISNEGIYRWELEKPIALNLPIEEQVNLYYQRMFVAESNTAFAQMYGFAKAEDFRELRLKDIHVSDSEKNLAFIRALAENGYRIRNTESEEIDVYGKRVFFLNSGFGFIQDGCVKSGWGTQIDITELREAQQALLAAEQARAELLKTMTTIANHLLRSSDYRLVLPNVLQLLGEAARADRCSLAQNITDPASGKSAVRMNAEWCRAGIQASVAYTPELASALLWEDFAELYERLIQGETVQFFGTDLCTALRELFESQGNKAMLMVPIVVQGEFWGVFGFDYCHEVRRFEELDQSIFAIAVDSIAAAIERQRSQQALLQAEQNRTAELAKVNVALRRSLDALSSDPDIERFVGHVLKVVAEQLDAPVTEYWSDSGNIACLELSCWQGEILTKEQLSLDPRTRGIEIPPELVNHEALDQRQHHFIVEDLPTDPVELSVFSPLGFDLEAWCRERGVRKHLNVPLRLGNKSIGSLGVYIPANRCLSEQQIELAYAFAQQVTLAIRLHQLAEEAKLAAIAREQEQAAIERAEQLAKANNALKRNLDSLATQPQLEAFLQSVVNEAATQSNAANAHLFLYDEQTNSLSLSVATDNGGDWRSLPDMELWKRPFAANSTPAWEVITSSRAPVVVEFEQASPLFWAGTFEWHQQRGHTRGITAPLWLGEKPLGFLGLAFTVGVTFTLEELELVQALAQQATLAIELTRLAEQSRHTAILEERNRIAQEIHDTLAQAFTGISIHLGIAHRLALSQSESVTSLIKQATELAHTGLAEARRSVWALQPDADEYRYLVPSLERVLQQMTSKTAIGAELRIVGTPYPLPPDVGLNLLRIGQEALTNALKYAFAQSLIVEIEFTLESVCLRVQDDGCGFDPTRHTDKGGFGLLGMQQRCERVRGELTITSVPGQGTAIVAWVPLVPGAATKGKSLEIPMSHQSAIRVLVVDDHPVVRRGLVTLLNLEPGVTIVAQASDGIEAVSQYRIHQPDVTLMDLRLPLMNGVEAIATIRQEFAAASILILTTYDGDEDIYRGLRAGALGYLLKDASCDEILDAIRTVHQGQKYLPTTVGVNQEAEELTG